MAEKVSDVGNTVAGDTLAHHAQPKLRAAEPHRLVKKSGELVALGASDEQICEVQQHEVLIETATGVLVAVWKAIQRGSIDERSEVADQILRLRDTLNPDWPDNSSWLPEELSD